MNESTGRQTDAGYRCGYVVLAGRPNVGKSTLLNRILGHKLSITSRRPQTTRWRILGIKTGDNCQAIYVDTPGIEPRVKNVMQRYLWHVACASVAEADVVVLVVEACKWTAGDEHSLAAVARHGRPLLLAVNKIDRCADKRRLLPYIDGLTRRVDFAAVVPVSARTGRQVDVLEGEVAARLPEQPALFPDDIMSDRSERFFAAEILREKLMRHLGAELPYQSAVTIEHYREHGGLVDIHALIWVQRPNHKPIVIGEDGERLKRIATRARLDMEKLLDSRVNLKCWVKVRENWTNDEKLLRDLGYEI